MSGTQARRTYLASLPLITITLLLVAGFFIFPAGPALADATIQPLPFSQDWTNTSLITVNDDWSGVPGILGYRGDDLTTVTGTDPQTILADGTTTPIDVNANQTNPNTFTTGGVTEFHLADSVVALTGSGTADAPFLLISINTTGLVNIHVSYNVRDLETGLDNAIQQVALHYRVGGTGVFTNLPAGYIADATVISATMVTPVSVALPAAADKQPLVQLRVMTTNAVGNDEWVGIDDINITGDPIPELIISKAAPGIVSPGETFTYTLTLVNAIQMAATNVIITDTLPANTTFVSASDGGVYAGGVISWTVPSMANGAMVNRSFQVMATTSAGLVITNDDYQAYASNWLTATIGAAVNTIVSSLDISITKTAPAYVLAGEPLAYGIDLQFDFSGNMPATHVVVTDTLPANISYVSDTSGFIPTFPSAGLVVWNLGDIPITTNEITFIVTVTSSATIPNDTIRTNQVEVSTDTLGDPLDNNTAQAQTTFKNIVPIVTARAGSPGQIFAVEGQVTYLPGTFSENDWGLQDASGGIVGYFAPPPDVELGDYVRLMATRANYSGQEEMAEPVYYVANRGPGLEVTPLITTTQAMLSGNTEGWLVQISGIITGLTTCPANQNYSFRVDDGSGAAMVYVDITTGIDVCAMGAANGKEIRVIGFSSQYGSDYELKPRRNSDIDVDANYPGISKDAPAVVSPGEVFTYTITVDNHLGYALTNVTVVDNLPANVSSSEGSTIVRSLGMLADRTQISTSFLVTATDQVTVVLNNSYFVTATEYTTPTYGVVATTFVVSGSLQIHDIQGSGHDSPFMSQIVENIRGVVTMRLSRGFYIQDITPDADPSTSEGIYVYTNSAPSVVVGDDVSLNGLVEEYNGMTELSGITGLTTYASGITVTPTSVSLPVPEGTDLEPYESMLVVFPQTLTAAQNYFQGRYGQVTLSAGRMYNPTNGNGLGDTVEFNLRRMIVLDDASTASYPKPVPYIGQDNTLRAGDTVAGVTGVVDYGLIASDSSTRFYRLQPTIVPTFTRVNERTAVPEDVGGSVRVASMNVLNYFNGDGLGGGFPAPRGAPTYAEFLRQRTKIITATVTLNADILGLMEIENDGYGSLSAIQDLVNGLNAATAPGTYTFIAEPSPGTDQIKVAMIYKPGVVTPVGAAMNYQVNDHPVYQPLYDRPPLVQQFTINATDQSLFVIVNHFKSKGSCPVSPTDPDAEYGQGCWNVKRVAQANGLLDLIADLESATGEPDALIIGDLNSYGEEDPILALTDGGMVNELAVRVAAEERYTYIFDGQSGYLDNALATASLDGQIRGATIWHINADEPEIISYLNAGFELYSPTAYRSSDHDPVLIGLDLPALAVEKGVELSRVPIQPGDPITYTITITNLRQADAIDVHIVDVLPAEVVGVSVDVTVTIPSENVYVIVIPATVAVNAPSGSIVTNTVYIYHSTGDISASVSFAWTRLYLPLIYRTP